MAAGCKQKQSLRQVWRKEIRSNAGVLMMNLVGYPATNHIFNRVGSVTDSKEGKAAVHRHAAAASGDMQVPLALSAPDNSHTAVAVVL